MKPFRFLHGCGTIETVNGYQDKNVTKWVCMGLMLIMLDLRLSQDDQAYLNTTLSVLNEAVAASGSCGTVV